MGISNFESIGRRRKISDSDHSQCRNLCVSLKEMIEEREDNCRLGVALHEVMAQFGWEDFAFIYSTVGDDDKCTVTKEDVEVRRGRKNYLIHSFRKQSLISMMMFKYLLFTSFLIMKSPSLNRLDYFPY